jgi:hypothetical protein
LTARNFGRDFLRYLRSADASRQPTHLLASALTTLRTKEKIMRTSLRTSTLVLAILGSISFAAAQSTPGDMQQEKLNLSQSKERQVTQGLSREQSQSAAGYQGQVGSKPPASLSASPMPDDVADQVPETKRYLFIKLPDRIVLIDPDTNMVAEIVGAPATTGANPGDANPAGSR